jgi:hypothetical protein
MMAILILVMGLVGNVSGQNSPVRFRAAVTAGEDHGIIPVCYGDYFVEVAIDEILEDATAVLAGITSVQVCYNDAQSLVVGENVEVYGYYWGGICPKQYCGRVQILDESYYIMRIEGYGDNDWMVSDSNMYSIPSGNVGIGTTTAQEKLHVVGNVRIEGTSPAWLNLVGGSGGDAGMSLTTKGLGVNKWEVLREGTSADFLIRETFPHPPFSGATLAVKAGSGNVGIGTNTPEATLEVNGEALIRAGGFTGNAAGATGALELRGASGTYGPSLALDNGAQQWNIVSWSDNSLKFVKSTGSTFTPLTINNNSFQNALVLASKGVGIGTASPQEKMHVVGNAIIEAEAGAGFGAPLRVEKDGTGRQLAAFFSNPADGASEVEIQMGVGTMLPSAWSLKAASGLFSIANVAVLPPALNIRSTGEVGIGTITPQGKLDVNGSIYQRGSQLHADYVFEPDYELESIEEHSEYMWRHKHLAAIPKARVDGNGQEIVEVGAHRKGIVEELEKAHIYIEQLDKRIKALEEKLVKLKAEVSTGRP